MGDRAVVVGAGGLVDRGLVDGGMVVGGLTVGGVGAGGCGAAVVGAGWGGADVGAVLWPPPLLPQADPASNVAATTSAAILLPVGAVNG
jgi:hypothetical protein